MDSGSEHILKLVEDLRNGVPTAASELLPLVYEDLRKLAATMLGRERASHTLQATALVNEACVKLMGGKAQAWNGQDHFLAVAAMAMRQVLVSHARAKHAAKRGGDGERLTLLDPIDSRGLPESCVDVLALEEALAALEK
ncbi:MAG: ECF-type sigma factor, partial [Planctomycetota bacterium]|nr:ECF-type sigma factor [Planctomycetota bacterium]